MRNKRNLNVNLERKDKNKQNCHTCKIVRLDKKGKKAVDATVVEENDS